MPEQLDAGIYKITNLVNQKVYIGQSKRLQQRLQQHRTQLESNRHFNKHLQRSYNKYGIENFKFEIIDYVDSISELDSLEGYYIELFNSSNSNKGFNKKTYIQGKGICTEETRKKLSQSHIGYKPSTEQIEKQRRSISKKMMRDNGCGHNNISYAKNRNSYSVEFKENGFRWRLGYFPDLQFAILIRDLFFSYPVDILPTMQKILEQYKTKYSYFFISKYNKTKYSVEFEYNKNRIRLHGAKTLEEAAIKYNTYILENNINKPLNIIPFDKGVWKNNQWYCELY